MKNALVWRLRNSLADATQRRLWENLRHLRDVSEETSLINLQGDVSEICKSGLFEMSLRCCMSRLRDASEIHPCPLGDSTGRNIKFIILFFLTAISRSCRNFISLLSLTYIHLYSKTNNKTVKISLKLQNIALISIITDIYGYTENYRSSRWQMSFKIVAFKNFTIPTWKHLRWSLVLPVAGIRPSTLLKIGSNTGVFL